MHNKHHKFNLSLSDVMLLLIILFGLFITFVIIWELSWKIYVLIYSDYTWGLMFPYAKFSSVLLCVTVVLCLLLLGVIHIIKKLRNNCR